MFPRPVPAAAPPRPYTVTELLAEVGSVLRTTWRDLSVVGEVARFDERGGHGYFVLKDKTATVSGIIFASDLRRVPFRIEPGLEVVVRGSLDLYAPQGRFQIKAFSVEPVGRGALQLAFEQLKARLEAEGLFAAERKRPIPKLPRRIAVVTSPSGAVLRDILHVLSRRFDGLAVTVYPVRVQGELAAAEIVAALAHLDRRGGFDVLILARGGGSPEDLAPFNDERVARALARSSIPTISGVGHETDVTIADLVADLRAPTPSAAAELVVPERLEVAAALAELARRARFRSAAGLAGARGELAAEGRALERLRPEAQLAQARERAGWLLDRATRHVGEDLRHRRAAHAALAARLTPAVQARLSVDRGALERAAAALSALGPQATLERGYAIVRRTADGVVVRDPVDAPDGELLSVRIAHGRLAARVEGSPENGRD